MQNRENNNARCFRQIEDAIRKMGQESSTSISVPNGRSFWKQLDVLNDSFKTELVADRVWQTRSQLELAIVEYISWFNDSRLHENLDDRPPREIEELYAAKAGTPITTS